MSVSPPKISFLEKQKTDLGAQTLRFVKSLPHRERQPLKNKFKNADPTGPPFIEPPPCLCQPC